MPDGATSLPLCVREESDVNFEGVAAATAGTLVMSHSYLVTSPLDPEVFRNDDVCKLRQDSWYFLGKDRENKM